MASITQSAHRVERVVITPANKFEAIGGEHVSRQLIIKFADGTEATIDIFSLPNSALPVEVQ